MRLEELPAPICAVCGTEVEELHVKQLVLYYFKAYCHGAVDECAVHPAAFAGDWKCVRATAFKDTQ